MIPVQHQIDRGRIRTMESPQPVGQCVTPKAPNLQSMVGDLIPIVAYKEELISALADSWQEAANLNLLNWRSVLGNESTGYHAQATADARYRSYK